MTSLAVAPVIVPLVTAAIVLLLRRWPRLQRTTSVGGSLAYAGVIGALVWHVVYSPVGGTVVARLGDWPAPFGITLVADPLSAFMLAITAIVTTFAIAFSVLYLDDDTQRTYYHPLFQFLVLGASGAFLTGDLFNLFVWFEVLLLPSYVFVAFYGEARHTAAAVRYVVLNVIGGLFMLLGVGGLYATTGTLNMAAMAQLLESGAVDSTPVVGVSAFLFVAFALKAGLVPFQFWVPAAYRSAPLPVVAVFAGVTKKVGTYAIVRVYFTVLNDVRVDPSVNGIAGTSALEFLAPVLLAMGVLSIAVGGLGAIGRDRLEGLLAYSSIGQVGFIAVPLAIAAGTGAASIRHLGVLAGLLFMLHHALAKGLLFLSVAAINDGTGTTRLSNLGGLVARSPLFAGVFLVGGLSLVGIPPLAGFFGKLFVFDVAVRALLQAMAIGGSAGLVPAVVLVVLLVGAVLTILYSTRAWTVTFWGPQTSPVELATVDARQVLLLATLAALVLLVGVGFEPVYTFVDAAAGAALDTEAYVAATDLAGGAGA